MSCLSIFNPNSGSVIKENNDGTVSVFIPDNRGLLSPVILSKECCLNISENYFFDENEQKCRYKPKPNCNDLNSFKINLNPINNDAAMFNVGDTEDCTLDISFNYVFKITCSTLSNLQPSTNNLINQQIIDLNQQINNQTVLCETLSSQILLLENQINQTPYSITCGFSVLQNDAKVEVNTTNFNFGSNGFSTSTSSNSVTTGLAGQLQGNTGIEAEQLAGTYCLTNEGLASWENLLGPTRYNLFINGYESSYDCNDVANILNLNQASLIPLLYECEVPFGTKSNLIAEKGVLEVQLDDCNLQLTTYTTQLNDLLKSNSNIINECIKPINFLENLDVSVGIDVVENGSITTVFESNFFPAIGNGNLYNYFIEKKDFTGFYVYDTISGEPLMIKQTSFNTCKTIPENILFDLQNQANLSSEELLNTISDHVLASNLVPYSILIEDENVIDLIKNKKIRLFIKINNTCDDLCVLLDNITINKNCSRITKTNIFVKECPGFKLEKIVDNKKSWLNNTTLVNKDFNIFNNFSQNPIRITNYNSDDDRLILNSKEIDLNINIGYAIENDVFSYVVDNECILTGTSNCRLPCENICCGDNRISFDKIMSKDLAEVNNVEDFRYFLLTELIDVKNRQTISGYPTLRALYDRYLNSNFYCQTQSSAFNYLTIDKFSELITTYWYDLIEQVIPATTIWGAVKIYSNTIFDQQKHRYRSYSTLFCDNPYNGLRVTSSVNATSGLTQNVGVELINITTGITLTTSVCNEVSLVQMNFGSEFIGSVSCLGNDCDDLNENSSIIVINST